MEAKLVVIGGKANMGEVKLRLPMTIGRGNKADLMISHPTVSREHCRLFEKNGELVVQDNGSSNGTFVDGEKIVAAVVVQPGQILAIGPLTFRAEYEAPTSNVSGATKSGPLADTQAIDSDELDLDFLLDDDAPAKPAPAKPKAEKKVEAKAPAVAPGKPAKNVPAEAKDKKAGGAPTIQEPTKSTKTTADAVQPPKSAPPVKEVKETAELDVDFLLDDLAEEQKQAPAAKDTSDIDLSDLGLDEPAAPAKDAKSSKVAPPEAKTPASAPKTEDFEQTIDFSGIGDDDDKPASAPMEDLLPSDDVKPGDIDFDFLSDLDDAEPAAAAKIEEPVKKADSPKIAPPPESVASAPVKEPPPAAAPEVAEPKAEAPPSIAPPEAPSAEKAAEPDFDLDDFLSDVDVGTSESAAAAPREESPVVPAAAAEVATPEPVEEKEEFDFSALSETQDVAVGPPAAFEATMEITAPETPATDVAEPHAAAPVEEASSPTIPDFDFLAEEKAEMVVDIGPVAEPAPVVETTEAAKGDDFDFLADLEEQPASAELPSVTPKVEAAEKAPDFSALAEPAADTTKAEAAKIEAAEDAFAFLDAESPAAPQAESPVAETAAPAEPDFGAFDLVAPAADAAATPVAEAPVVEAEKPAGEFDFESLVVDEIQVNTEPADKAPTAEAAAFDFLADSPAPAEAKATADDFDFLAGDKPEPPAASTAFEETAMFVAGETPVADMPATSTAPTPEFTFDQPKAPAAALDFGALDAVEAKTESESDAEFGMFAAPPSSAEAATEAAPEAESAPIAFAPAAKAAPSSPVAKKPAAKGPSFLEKVKLLFGGSKSAPAKKAGAKKSGPAAPVAPTGYQPVVAHPVKPIDAPIPLDDTPIPLDDFAPIDTAPAVASPAETAATEMFAGLASLEPPTAETPSVAAASEIPSETSPSEAAASIAPPVDVDATAMFDAFAAEAPVVEAPAVETPAAETSDAPAQESADDRFGDLLADGAADSGSSADAEAADLDFSLDEMTPAPEPEVAAADEWSLESPVAETPVVEPAQVEGPAADQLELDFLSEELAEPTAEAAAVAPEPIASDPAALEAIAEATQEPIAEVADLLGSLAAESPVSELATPSSPRRPAHIDVDLRLSSSLRPLARVHVQRPRHDLPEMEPEEPAGRSFTPRAKTPTAPSAEPEAAAEAIAPTPFDVPTESAPATDISAGSEGSPGFEVFDFGGDAPAPSAEVASAPEASLGDADFDFLAKEQEAEAALDRSGAASVPEASADPTADLFAGLESAAAPAPAEPEEEFIISLDELSAEPAAEVPPATEGAPVADVLGEGGIAKETAAPDAGFELDYLDLEVSSESPALVEGLEVIDVVEETPASNDEEKSTAQPVTAKKAPAEDDKELADFLRDLGMN